MALRRLIRPAGGQRGHRRRLLMITVDLDTKILPQNHEVFFARAGDGYRLYPEFVAEEAVFADLPGLGLTPGVAFADQDKLNQRLHRSRALRNWHVSQKNEPRPSDDLNDYPAGAGDGGISQLRGALSGFFERAKKGDLVVITPYKFSDLAYVGEFTGGPQDIESFTVPRLYGDDELQGRRVKWRLSVVKRYLDDEILNISAKPNIFVTLPRSVRRALYEEVYDGFTFDGDFSIRFDVTQEIIKSYDDLLIQSFVNFVAVNTRALDDGTGENFVAFKDAAFVDAGDYTPELRVEVSSPGFINLYSPKITPLVVAALFALALTVGEDAFSAAKKDMIRIGNSQSAADDACVAEVQKQALNQIKLSGADGWAEACERARQAAIRTGIRGPAKVKQ